MEKYDVGILTFWNVPNYGTFAQAYALQKVLENISSGRVSRQIAYLNKNHFDFYYSKKPIYTPRHLCFYTDVWRRMFPFSKYNKKKKMFLDNYDKVFHTSSLDANQLKETDFKTVIIGSDIVWDFSFRMFDNDSFLFGEGIRAKSINSYAASFGTVKENAKLPQYVINGIKKMNNISVRDFRSANIIEKITGNKPQIVLDPTYLWDFKNDNNIVKPTYDDYMVVYGQDFNKNQINQIVEFAEENNLLLICLDCNDDNYKWCDVNIKQYKLTPFEWIGYFMCAKYIATTTFHGLTFSIIFNKKFAFCKTQFIMDKAGDYLKAIKLYDLFNKDNVSIKEMLEHNWDYRFINDHLDKERKKSIEFLKKILDK